MEEINPMDPALRHPGSAATHQFQAAQGAEGLSHVQPETQGEHGRITSAMGEITRGPRSPLSSWKNPEVSYGPRMLMGGNVLGNLQIQLLI